MGIEVPPLSLSLSSYPDRIAELFHFMAQDESGCTGFGTDPVRSKAFLKAVTECAERHVMKSMITERPRTSSGFAGHSDPEIARQKAHLELIERDAFLLGWASGMPPQWLSDGDLAQQSRTIRKVLKGLTMAGFHPRIGLVAKTGDVITAVGALRPSLQSELDFGAVLGTAAGYSIEACIESVTFELARAGTVILNRKEKFQRIYNIEGKLPTDGRSTFDYYLDTSRADELEFYFAEGRVLTLSNPEVHFSRFERRISEPELKLHIARAECADVQPLFFGYADDSKINFNRFKDCGLNFNTNAVMPLP